VEEDLVSIQQPQQPPPDHQRRQRQDQCRMHTGVAGQAAREEFGDPVEIDEAVEEIDRDGIHADHDEEERPFLEAQYVENLIRDFPF